MLVDVVGASVGQWELDLKATFVGEIRYRAVEYVPKEYAGCYLYRGVADFQGFSLGVCPSRVQPVVE
jgi:hypothetical protein